MKTLHSMLVKMFIPVFLVTMLFFIMVFQLMDVFSNIQKYLTKDVSMLEIGKIALFYLPKCFSYSLPIGFLFSITFTLGNFYMNNELVAVFGSGISLYHFTLPFLLLSILLCLLFFVFEETVVIPTFKIKNELYREVLKQPEPYTNHNIALKTPDNRFIFQAKFFNGKSNSFNDLMVIERDEKGSIIKIVDSRFANWNGKNWTMEDCRIYTKDPVTGIVTETSNALYNNPDISAPPKIFQKQSRNIDEMNYRDASEWIKDLKLAGKPYEKELSEYYKKFAFAFTPLIVAMISSAVGGLLRKNVLLMSMLASICIVVVYYVVQMMTMSLSSNGYISPILGAWSAFFLFIIVGIVLFRLART